MNDQTTPGVSFLCAKNTQTRLVVSPKLVNKYYIVLIGFEIVIVRSTNARHVCRNKHNLKTWF